MASFYLSCMLVVTLVRCIPWIGTPASLLLNCVIMGYYCFEYKWIDLGWTQAHRMAFVERHWAYFLGFGLPATLLTFFLTTLHAGAVFALVYPSFVILACVSTMKPYDSSRLPHLPVMMGVRTVNRLCQLGIDAAMGSRSSRDRYTTDSFGMNKDKGALL
ncbi:etoposide-induced protein 2.4-domain-containing protein [Gongronella butleri]|nr:etoposide-induced protein 2.4-domain-containing protein [Gongronella butleri]